MKAQVALIFNTPFLSPHSKFWTRNRLGDKMKDKYNLNIQDGDEETGKILFGISLNFDSCQYCQETAVVNPFSAKHDM